jgi:hypothetical protein
MIPKSIFSQCIDTGRLSEAARSRISQLNNIQIQGDGTVNIRNDCCGPDGMPYMQAGGEDERRGPGGPDIPQPPPDGGGGDLPPFQGPREARQEDAGAQSVGRLPAGAAGEGFGSQGIDPFVPRGIPFIPQAIGHPESQPAISVGDDGDISVHPPSGDVLPPQLVRRPSGVAARIGRRQAACGNQPCIQQQQEPMLEEEGEEGDVEMPPSAGQPQPMFSPQIPKEIFIPPHPVPEYSRQSTKSILKKKHGKPKTIRTILSSLPPPSTADPSTLYDITDIPRHYRPPSPPPPGPPPSGGAAALAIPSAEQSVEMDIEKQKKQFPVQKSTGAIRKKKSVQIAPLWAETMRKYDEKSKILDERTKMLDDAMKAMQQERIELVGIKEHIANLEKEQMYRAQRQAVAEQQQQLQQQQQEQLLRFQQEEQQRLQQLLQEEEKQRLQQQQQEQQIPSDTVPVDVGKETHWIEIPEEGEKQIKLPSIFERRDAPGKFMQKKVRKRATAIVKPTKRLQLPEGVKEVQLVGTKGRYVEKRVKKRTTPVPKGTKRQKDESAGRRGKKRAIDKSDVVTVQLSRKKLHELTKRLREPDGSGDDEGFELWQ